MHQSLTLLLVDPSELLFHSLVSDLPAAVIQVLHNPEPETAIQTLKHNAVDILILDYGSLPSHDISFVKMLRQNGNQSFILMLSYFGTTQESVECLDAGADDYLTRPFAHAELNARIRSLARHALETNLRPVVEDVSGLQLDPVTLSATFDHCSLSLTRTEYRVLAAIIGRKGATISLESLISELYGYEIDSSHNAIEVHISAIRRKLKRVGAPDTIFTRRGFGYYII